MTPEPAAPHPTYGRSILFVCTGNTCRSPLAEGLCREMLAQRLGIPVEELPARGYTIRSAGLSAFPGDSASAEAIGLAQELGFDLRSHRSRPVNPQLLAEATDVYTMTVGHLAVLTLRFPDFGPNPKLLADPLDIPDPIGGDSAEYAECATLIRRQLQRLISEWTST